MLLIALLVLAQPDPCSWITAAQLTKEFGGQSFASPVKSDWPAVYRGQNSGTKCVFKGSTEVQLIAFVDRSPAESKQTFESMMGSFYKVESKPSGLGDEAYFDKQHGLHVLKGKVRFFVQVGLSDHTAAEQHARNIAQLVLPST